LSFFNDLHQKLGAPGDFAQAYVLAHEVGHHVQNLTGTFGKIETARGRASQAEANRIIAAGQAQIEQERQQVREELRREVARLAVAGAEQINAPGWERRAE